MNKLQASYEAKIDDLEKELAEAEGKLKGDGESQEQEGQEDAGAE